MDKTPQMELQLRVDLAKSISLHSTKPAVKSLCTLLLDEYVSSSHSCYVTACYNFSRTLPSSTHGLLLDWLELLDPEVMTSCPDIQRKIVFEQKEVNRGISKSHQPYMLAVLTHRCNWASIHNAMVTLLKDQPNCNRLVKKPLNHVLKLTSFMQSIGCVGFSLGCASYSQHLVLSESV
jgi:integrator complex subunit 1